MANTSTKRVKNGPAARKRPTIADVAKLAGVSKTSVSKALFGGSSTAKVSEKSAEKIRAAAEKINFIPSLAARSLATKSTGFIGYVIADQIPHGWENFFFTRYFAGVERMCRQRGYGLYAARLDFMEMQGFVFPEKIHQQSVDGLIVVGALPETVVRQIQEMRLPAIYLNRGVEHEKNFPTFCPDSFSAIERALTHAAGLGHRSILVCNSYSDPVPLEKYKSALKRIKKSLGDIEITRTELLDDIPYDEARAGKMIFDFWLSRKRKDSFIFGHNQYIYCFMRNLLETGFKCPEDVSVMTLSDSAMNEYFAPPLGAVDSDFEKIGGDAAGVLIDNIEAGVTKLDMKISRNDYPAAKIIDRRSVRRAE
jgi:DNA-binding LacI/PurR family transcriptional regulator